MITEKKCPKCDTVKPASDFNKDKSKNDGLRSYCKSCAIANATKWIHDNRQAYNARIRKDRKANPEKYSAWSKNYASTDRGKEVKRAWTKNNPDRRSKISSKYAKNNKDKCLINVRKRQARKLKALPQWADLQVISAIYKTAAAVNAISKTKIQVDHIVPLQNPLVCGLHCEFNLRLLSEAENKSKGNRYWPDMPDTGAIV